MLEHLNKILAEDNDPEKYIKKCNDYMEKVRKLSNIIYGYRPMARIKL